MDGESHGSTGPQNHPARSCPNQDSGCCEITHRFLVSDPLSQDFLGLTADNMPTAVLPIGYWGISGQRPRPHHRLHLYNH